MKHFHKVLEGHKRREDGLFSSYADKPWSRGRAFWHLDGLIREVTFEWDLWSNFCHAYIQAGNNEDNVKIGLALPPVAVWLTATSPLIDKIPTGNFFRLTGGKYFTRELGAHLWFSKPPADAIMYDVYVSWKLLTETGGWTEEWPWWANSTLSFSGLLDRLFGHFEMTEEVVSEDEVEVPMPEGTYKGVVKLVVGRWKRPWLPLVRRLHRAHITIQKGPPAPGKGENSWDQGDRAISEATCSAHSVPQAVAQIVEWTLRDRRRYGGKKWRPEAAS